MSAQLTLTDLEMELILKCTIAVVEQRIPLPVLTAAEQAAVVRLGGKIAPHLDRPSRRSRRHG